MLCIPALIYLILGVISLVYLFSKYSFGTVLLKAVFIGLWTWLLNFICSKGYPVISWIILLLPFIMFGIFMLIIYEHLGTQSNKEKYSNMVRL
jgi:hypothetical protein